jgi:uncharacterized protein (DUF1778 family)
MRLVLLHWSDMNIRRRKPRTQRKEESIRIRVTEDQKRLMSEAADRKGLDVSAWLRSLGLQEAEIARAALDVFAKSSHNDHLRKGAGSAKI